MLITRKSFISGVTRTKDLNITQEQYDKWERGTPVQEAFPNLSRSDCEFIVTGVSDEEWDETFKEDEND